MLAARRALSVAARREARRRPPAPELIEVLDRVGARVVQLSESTFGEAGACEELVSRLSHWERNALIKAVIFEGDVFGGFAEAPLAARTALYRRIAAYDAPVVAVVDGIVTAGGVGFGWCGCG